MTELATAWITILPETSKIPPAVNRALGQVDRQAERTGRSMGTKMSGALGTALKGGAVAAAAAGGAAIGTALYKGFDRLSAIDQAKGKLAGLGNSAQTTATVMDSALASVKGTAYGLGDAATIAASAIAAGIKPGQDLTKYLSSTADAASIAGSSLSEMGSIFNQVQTGQQAYTDDLNQLADRGIPIYQWLAKEMGVAAKEVKGLAADGKVSSEIFFKAIDANIAGAALESGKTVKGSFENMIASMGRLGAAVEGPTFERLPGFFTSITGGIDALTPKAEALATAFDAKVFDEWAPKLQSALDTFQASGSLDDAREVLAGLGDAVGDLAPSVGQIATELGRASAALGVSGWQLLLVALQAGTTTLEILNPLLSTTAELMEDNTGLVTAFMAGWLAFRTVPRLVGGITSTLGPLASGLRSAGTNVGAFGEAYRTSLGYVRQANPTISTANAHLQVLRRNGMNATGAMSALRGGAGLMTGALGGPLGLALAAGGLALGAYTQHQQKAADQARRHKEMVDALSESINFNTGALDENGKKRVYQGLTEAGAFANARKGGVAVTSEQIQAAGEGQQTALDEVNAQIDAVVRNRVTAVISDRQLDQLKQAGISIDEYTAALRGNADAQKKFADAGIGRDWNVAANDLGETAKAAVELGYALGDSNQKITESRDAARQQAEALGTVQKNFTTLAGQFKDQGRGFSIEVDNSQLAGTENALRQMGFTLQSLPNGQVKVTADTDQATARLQTVVGNVELLNAIKANPQVDLNKASFDAKTGAAHAALLQIDRTSVSGEAGLTIDKLLQGSNVSLNELIKLDQTTANPKVDMLIDKIMEKVGIVNKGLDDAARERTVSFRVQMPDGSWGSPAYAGDTYSGPGRAEGGWTGPGSKWQPAGVVHADEFVVKKASRRALESAMPGALDYMNRTGEFPSALGYADGGRVTADALNRFPRDEGLEGSPYVWAGVHWGDCSATQSGIARYAVGLDPWAGRSSTAGFAAYLPQLGFQLGRGNSGDYRIGWKNGGPGGGHTAGTLPDGTNVEMGGARGNGQVGGQAAGADDPQFTQHAFLPLGPSWTDPGSDAGGYVQRPDGTWEPVAPGAGDYSSTSRSGISGATTAAPSNSLSGRLGDAAKAGVEGQLKSLFDMFGINDTPGILAAATEFEQQRQQSTGLSQQTPGAKAPTVTDPGTQTPAPGEDLGGIAAGLPTTGSPIKDAFRSGLREVWRQGQPWTDTDWIINKESTWNPKARNGKYFGLAQLGPEAWAASGIAPTEDPRLQGTAYDKYVGPRYGDPMAARKHWDQEGWYDVGGVIHEGTTLMRNGLGHKETALPFDPKDLKRSLDTTGSADLGGKLDRVIALLELSVTQDTGRVTYNLPDDQALRRVQRRRDSERRAAIASL
ncbi:MAG: hypothetical protein CME34_18815 [Gordonia sp.]|uniref:aggregation-promoting factor C-terminal-like domain-containing protein n=1 Tax=Gordonia sp. (in: high G+C Gram-positive bacteria) TaxID=84139 RepID=UPI000C3E51A3|nr:tape measure protein [Gordonia sp. (in: high G+C Gram-positive bacteria)]MAU83879.1 hypothetical protein [Gordonia sp. (in: high G+C Gram-positive bacteria)]